MKIPDETSTIVLLGNWNPYILMPEWVGKHIFEEEKITAEFLFGPALFFRFRARGTKIVTSQDRVTILADKTGKGSLREIGDLARKLLMKLPYTPIGAVGVNHAFVESCAGKDLLRLFDFGDKEKLPPETPVEHLEIHRRLAGDGHSINIKISKDQDSEDVRFDFNFHYQNGRDFNEQNDQILKKGVVLDRFEFAKNLLISQYGLELEEG
ncbi:MAG: hypothetical protein JW759_04435 [Candidatus Coatesbacteria bacterium]|nr:hypothetical protein [Candidatus Coatesbacteria bacterium]